MVLVSVAHRPSAVADTNYGTWDEPMLTVAACEGLTDYDYTADTGRGETVDLTGLGGGARPSL